jgi:hypothetical protein
MLTKDELKIVVRDLESTLKHAPLSDNARLWYEGRYYGLLFALEATGLDREPPTDNNTLNDYPLAGGL